MKSLDSREAYCLSLIIANGGNMDYNILRDVVLQYREPFQGLKTNYIKNKKVKKVIGNLVDEGIITEMADGACALSIEPALEEYIIKKHANYFCKAMKHLNEFRREHFIDFNLSFAQETILSDEWAEFLPYDLVDELKKAINTHQRTRNHSAVITNCGRCSEIIIKELNEQYSLFPPNKQITKMISEIKEKAVIEKFSNNREKKETFRIFGSAIYTIYQLRHKLGAHADWKWGEREIATSCLILTLYLADLYSMDIRKEQ